ncbi:hypothetical protein [Ralstonia pseudosolanacearum]|uniref:hypothetical protein n=1 Tax=Ralstonia pseudosolanacearum TaxID=1310165 RepID=UPI002234D802|nr:hypothetical protein [Ralstonia sp. RS642]UZF26659.1 hypothetical protein LGV80_09175 [Ralstonia sp. RS642]
MTPRSLTWAPETPRFYADMTCCRPARVSVGLACKRPYQQCCAWHHIRLVVRHRGEKTLVQFADHLLSVCGWTLGEVFFSFNAAREISSLARRVRQAMARHSIRGRSRRVSQSDLR